MTTPFSPTATTSGAGRVYNFTAGPAVMPEEVLMEAREDLLNIGGSGLGVIECGHRGKIFDRILEEAVADCRAISGVSDDYEILFMPGGASMQFTLIPMNVLRPDESADFIHTGVWTGKAMAAAKHFGGVSCLYDGESDGFRRAPARDETPPSLDAAYTHYCSNNTIYGTRSDEPPKGNNLVCDATSDIFSRRWPIDRHAIYFAGAQKNLGPAGVALVFIRRDFLERMRDDIPHFLRYAAHAEANSRLNTPATFNIYFMGRVLKWILREGLEVIERRNTEKAAVLYRAIDESGGFYRGFAEKFSRSHMNITLTTGEAELDDRFAAEAECEGMAGLAGHRAVGGLRASIYNAFPVEGCRALAAFMKDFASRH